MLAKKFVLQHVSNGSGVAPRLLRPAQMRAMSASSRPIHVHQSLFNEHERVHQREEREQPKNDQKTQDYDQKTELKVVSASMLAALFAYKARPAKEALPQL